MFVEIVSAKSEAWKKRCAPAQLSLAVEEGGIIVSFRPETQEEREDVLFILKSRLNEIRPSPGVVISESRMEYNEDPLEIGLLEFRIHHEDRSRAAAESDTIPYLEYAGAMLMLLAAIQAQRSKKAA